MRRKRGLQIPLNFYQITSALLLLLLVLTFYLFVGPSLAKRKGRKLFIILYSVLVGLVLALFILTAGIDPSDPYAYQDIHTDLKRLVYCSFCKANVQLGSKHCRRCNRCVHNFDHHCVWLNTCIGSKNYSVFFALVLSSTFLCLLSMLVGLYHFINGFTSKSLWKISASRHFSGVISLEGYQVIDCIFIFLAIILILPLLDLLYFHIKLWFYDMSTHQYILRCRAGQTSFPIVCRHSKIIPYDAHIPEVKASGASVSISTKSSQIAPESKLQEHEVSSLSSVTLKVQENSRQSENCITSRSAISTSIIDVHDPALEHFYS